MAAAIAALRKPLAAELAALASADEISTLQDLDRGGDGPTPSSAKASDAVQGAYGAVGEASGAAASLFTTGRLMFEGAACDLALDRMKTYAQVTKALNALLPQSSGESFAKKGWHATASVRCAGSAPAAASGQACTTSIWHGAGRVSLSPTNAESRSGRRRGPEASSRLKAFSSGIASSRSTTRRYALRRSFKPPCAATPSARRFDCESITTASHERSLRATPVICPDLGDGA